ncbi:uncharacterized protein LOC116951122 isoform X1 [Petromyzon marinus]|uniref:Uncharacterized protein LOC116951122 n=2 Tax=Petromyzon marinus TaxID=7757 RepID=A0AAJ7TXJ9_PETMA|nr:uncharacterized protein LOC116951122 [Petromyzon marinus]
METDAALHTSDSFGLSPGGGRVGSLLWRSCSATLRGCRSSWKRQTCSWHCWAKKTTARASSCSFWPALQRASMAVSQPAMTGEGLKNAGKSWASTTELLPAEQAALVDGAGGVGRPDYGVTWRRDEVATLLSTWASRSIQRKALRVGTQLQSVPRDRQCRTKIKKLKSRYQQLREWQRAGACISWPFFQCIKAIMAGGQHGDDAGESGDEGQHAGLLFGCDRDYKRPDTGEQALASAAEPSSARPVKPYDEEESGERVQMSAVSLAHEASPPLKPSLGNGARAPQQKRQQHQRLLDMETWRAERREGAMRELARIVSSVLGSGDFTSIVAPPSPVPHSLSARGPLSDAALGELLPPGASPVLGVLAPDALASQGDSSCRVNCG